MTLTIEVPPAVEDVLQDAATRQGMPVPDFVLRMIVSQLSSSVGPAVSPADGRNGMLPDAERARRLEAWDELETYIQSLPDNRAAAGLPPLDDTGISRADFYGYTEREDAEL